MRQDFQSVNCQNEANERELDPVPLALDPWVAGAAFGVNKDKIYELVDEKMLRKLPGGGRIKIIRTSAESFFGARITPEIYEAARRLAEEKRKPYLAYQAKYREDHPRPLKAAESQSEAA